MQHPSDHWNFDHRGRRGFEPSPPQPPRRPKQPDRIARESWAYRRDLPPPPAPPPNPFRLRLAGWLRSVADLIGGKL